MNMEMQAAVDYLYDLPRFTKKNPLTHTRSLMELLGNPCTDGKVIHVAGSNGKGSVCCFLYSMLLAGGARAAMFTSPHLVDIRERFQICGDIVGEEAFMDAYGRVTDAVRKLVAGGEEHPTFFEMVYAIGMVIFERAQAEYIVLEAGLGGRLDATNSFPDPVITVITPVSLEHTDILGTTLETIAAEKAGILKAGVPVVFAADEPEAAGVIASRAEELGCPAVPVSRTSVHVDEIKKGRIDFSLNDGLGGQTAWHVPGNALYQTENAALAITAMHVLNGSLGHMSGSEIPEYAGRICGMDDAVLQLGIDSAVWPGRMHEVLPDVYFDGAHNPSGIAAFLESAGELAKEDKYPPMLLFSMAEDKNIRASVEELSSAICWDSVIVTTVPGSRGIPAERTAALFDRPVDVTDDCRRAFLTARERKKEGQKLFCTGSLYMIGALTETLEKT